MAVPKSEMNKLKTKATSLGTIVNILCQDPQSFTTEGQQDKEERQPRVKVVKHSSD